MTLTMTMTMGQMDMSRDPVTTYVDVEGRGYMLAKCMAVVHENGSVLLLYGTYLLTIANGEISSTGGGGGTSY